MDVTTYNIFRLNFIFMYMQQDIHETRYFLKTFKNFFNLASIFPEFSSILAIFFQLIKKSALICELASISEVASIYRAASSIS